MKYRWQYWGAPLFCYLQLGSRLQAGDRVIIVRSQGGRSLLWENDSFIDAPLHEILKYLQILHAGFTLDKCWLVHPCTVWWMTISRRWILSRYLGIVTCYSPRSRHWPGWRASGHSRAWVPTSCVLAALCSAMEHYCYIIAALLAPISWQIARCSAVTRDVNESSRNCHHIWRSQLPY